MIVRSINVLLPSSVCRARTILKLVELLISYPMAACTSIAIAGDGHGIEVI